MPADPVAAIPRSIASTCLTFDCYGTLIDWETGLLAGLRAILDPRGVDGGRRGAARAVRGPRVGARVGTVPALPRGARARRATPSPGAGRDGDGRGARRVRRQRGRLAGVPRLAPRRSPGSSERFALAVITNCDDDLFAASNRRLGVEFDFVITAQQCGGYKPDPHNFEVAFERIDRPRERILHVAQSLFHDHVPAKALGMTTVWINRRHDRPGSGATPPPTRRRTS